MLKHWQYKLLLGIALIAGGTWAVWNGLQQSATLLALDTNTGKIQWFQPLGLAKDFYSRGAIASNNTVVLGLAESSTPGRRADDIYRIRAFDVRSGNPLWMTELKPPVDGVTETIGYWFASTYAIEVQPNAVYAQIGDELRSLDPRSGQIRWAIKRPWLNASDRPLRFGLGLAATEQSLAVLQLGQRQRFLQTIDPNTGKVIRQTTIAFQKLESTSQRITAGDRLAFLETSGLIPSGDGFLSSGQATLTAYNLDTGQVKFRVPIVGQLINLQTVGQTLQLSTDVVLNFKGNSAIRYDRQFMGLDLQTGRVLWQRAEGQLNCYESSRAWRVDAESVFLYCNRRQNKRDSTTILSLSTRTGQTQWQTLVSPNRFSEETPSAIAPRQFLTFRRVSGANQSQLQAIALDRLSGKLLWSKALFGDRMDQFRSQVATDQDKMFVFDSVPQWQLWLLGINRDWYLNRANEVKP